MLNLDHPQAKIILAISQQDVAILLLAQKMTLANVAIRKGLMSEVNQHLVELRGLCVEGWDEPTAQLE